jgi:hypothetical protein
MRQAIGLLPNFPTEGVQRPQKELGLGLPSIREQATQMGVEHLVTTMNKDTERGYLAHAHSLRLLTQFGHWPTEALESNPLKLPTLRILRLASTIHGLAMDSLPSLHLENETATGLRAASEATNTTRIESRRTITSQQGTREYDKLVRQNCKPLDYSNTLLKHLAPLWATGTHKWTTILTIARLSPSNPQIHIRNTEAILARLPNKGQYASDLQLRTSIDTLRTTLPLPANIPHRKLPKDPTQSSTLVHPTWHTYITQTNIPVLTRTSYLTLTAPSSNPTPPQKRSIVHITGLTASPQHLTPASTYKGSYTVTPSSSLSEPKNISHTNLKTQPSGPSHTPNQHGAVHHSPYQNTKQKNSKPR